MNDRQTTLRFESPEIARLFVHRLIFLLKEHLAVYVDGVTVIVVDGGDDSREMQIQALARAIGMP